MARYQVQGPDGSMHIIEGPDNASPADIEAFAAQSIPTAAASAPTGPLDRIKAQLAASGGELKNLTLGAVRGAGSIGATILAPVDAMTGNTTRRQDMTDALQSLGADPNSFSFKAGKLGGEVAGTAGAGGLIGRAAAPILTKVAPEVGPQIVNALRTNGFTTGAPAAPGLAGTASNLAIRGGAGAVAGGAQVGLADPSSAGTGALIGGVLPGAIKLAEPVGNALADAGQAGARRLMESALKPTLKQKQTGEAATAVQTLLDYGINPTKGGVEKLNGLISDLNDQVSSKIAGSSATISPQNVVNALASTEKKFGNQVAPTADLNAINNVKQDFLNNGGAGDIPVQLAQQLKQGTYATLKGKYGQMGSAETEATKGLARGLKDEIATAVPEVGPLNAEESRLISTLNVTERRAMMDVNKNPLGLAALAIHEPTAFVAFMADKSALFKSLAARTLNAASQKAPALNALAGPAAYRALPRYGQQQP